MKLQKLKYQIFVLILVVSACGQKEQNQNVFIANEMMIRIAELEIYPEHLNEYLIILKEEAEASVRLEAGVISIYPMYIKENPNKIKILEIYKDKEAYELHLQTPHFKHYKTSTFKMVKSLNLVDMEALDKETMPKIFEKLSK
ncbi:putative quinol monooxygenase [Flammeovirgaceae bacterium SG7u.111]|nr:putative quinol monooxygenase [Flammeovirgaceae bacterium SG7u.132]WPO37245.1 putative quinol monooxygenase [Flammeovirgaceae bacterium SG7u.111]